MNDKISSEYHSIYKKKEHVMEKWLTCILKWFVFTFESVADVVRGSHVTTGDRFCGAVDNVGGFGNVLVTGRQTQANIFRSVYYFLFNRYQNVNNTKMFSEIQYWIEYFLGGFYFGPMFELISCRVNQSFIFDPNYYLFAHLFII